MRLGGSVAGPYPGAEAFVAAARDGGFRAVTFPLGPRDRPEEIDRLVRALAEADILIAELGAWNINLLSPDREERRAAREACQERLALADRIGARCCVSVAGSHGLQWDGPSADAYGDAVFAEVVESVQGIIDGVKPTRTVYCLETMPWMVPYSAENYRRLLEAVNRPGFAVHLDTVNLINSPEKYYHNAALTGECFELLGSRIVSIHIKDIILRPNLTLHLDECPVGEGAYDLSCLLRHAAALDPETPVLVEHLGAHEDYKRSVAYLKNLLTTLGSPRGLSG